jgi:uncharacterized GH25 family protein
MDVVFKIGKGLVIAGRATDKDGKPVAGAKVLLLNSFAWRGSQGQSTTNAAGNFTLSGLDPLEQHEIALVHEQRRLAATATVKAAKEQKRVGNLEVKLEPLAVMTGRVLDDEKKPIAGASVYAYVTVQVNQGGQTFFTAFTPFAERTIKTDKDGKFTLDFVVPGLQSYVYATMEGYTQANGPQFKLTAGEQKVLGDLTISRADQNVGGVVVDPIGRPIPGVQVYASSRRGGAVTTSADQVTATDKDGRFKIGKLPRGPVEINAMYPPDEPITSISNRVRSETGRDDARIVLFLRRKPGAAEAAIGKPAPEFPVASWRNCKLRGEDRTFTRAGFQGKVVLLAFVDEAKPSQRVLPQLQVLEERLRDQGLFVLRVYEGGEAEELAKLSPLPMAIVHGGIVPGYAEAIQKYGVRATPTLFLIDKKGMLRQADVKPEELDSKIQELLKE